MKKIIAGLMLIVCFLTACSAEQNPQVVTQAQESEESAVSTPAEAASFSEETTEVTEPTEESTVETSVAPTGLSEPTTEPATESIAEQVTQAPATTQPPTTGAVTEPTEPTEPENPVSEPKYETIDISALEAYGRAYAETLGYDGDPNTGFATNAGYFPPSWMKIQTMEEGYRRIKELVDAQYADDIGAGHAIVVIIDGVERHRKLNIYIEPTDEANLFLIYCFYGGE